MSVNVGPYTIGSPYAGLNSITAYANNLASSQYNNAVQSFSNIPNITDQVVQDYLQAADQANSLATNNLSRYTNVFQPEENQLVADANSYTSPTRIGINMGAAESDTGQAMDSGRLNAESQLRSFGIDPSSGRYAELEAAQDSQRAAAQAGAGQVAERATEDTGRQLRQQAIAVGQQYPGQIVNALNVEAQGLAGAENSTLGAANTLGGLYGRGNGTGGGGGGGARQPQQQSSPRGGVSFPGGGNNSTGGLPPFNAGPLGPAAEAPGAYSVGQDFSGAPLPYMDQFTGNQFGGSQGSDGIFQPNNYSDPSTYNASATVDPLSASGVLDSTNYSSGSGFDASASGSGGGDISGGYSDTYDNSGDTSFALGGGVPDAPTTGGGVPYNASPSQGMQTDDVPANLNAGEFVVPRDVAAWKGQEFFQKLIQQSRKARMTAPAHGQPGPARQGAPSFVSQGA